MPLCSQLGPSDFKSISLLLNGFHCFWWEVCWHSLWRLRKFILSVVFSTLIIMCFAVVLYRFTLLKIYWTLESEEFVISIKFRNFSPIIFSHIFPASFLSCTTRMPISPISDHLIYSRSCYCSVLLYIMPFFLPVVHSRQLLLYLQTSWYFPLTYLFCC